MKQVLICCLLLLCLTTQAQSLLLKVNLSECPTCKSNLYRYAAFTADIPSFVVFPAHLRDDSIDLEYTGHFSEHGFSILFNTPWYNKLNSIRASSTISCLDEQGKIVVTLPFTGNNTDTIQDFLANIVTDKQPATYISRNGKEYSFNAQLGKLTIKNNNGRTIKTIRSADIELATIAARLTGEKQELFKKHGETLNRKMTGFNATFSSFRLEHDKLLGLFAFHSTPGNIREEITDEYALVQYDTLGNYQDMNLIELPDNVVFYEFDFFTAPNGDLFLYCYDLKQDPNKFPLDSVRNYLYQLRQTPNGIYQLYQRLDLGMPYVHKLKYGFNNLTSSLSFYPFVVNQYDNTVYNLATARTYKIINDSIYKKTVNANTEDYWAAHFRILATARHATKCNCINIIYKLGNEYFLSELNGTTGKLHTEKLFLSQMADKLGSMTDLAFWMASDQILVRFKRADNANHEFCLPLSLLHQTGKN